MREVLARKRQVKRRCKQVQIEVLHTSRRRVADERVALAGLEGDHHHGMLALRQVLLQFVPFRLHAGRNLQSVCPQPGLGWIGCKGGAPRNDGSLLSRL